jgi:uncharacterized membrane protein YfcA
LVPLLVLTDTPAADAAPLGLISVAAGSLAAASRQLRERSVNHRLGVTTETAATAGAIAGAVTSGAVSDTVLTYVLAATAAAAALAGGKRKGIRNPPVPGLGAADVGERIGGLGGAYPVDDGVAPYTVRRLPLGLGAMTISGLVAGLAGASGGFIKTPATSELMHVPVKVAASTTTFTIGITSSAALLVFAIQGRIDIEPAAAVVAGSLVGGWLGAGLQAKLSPPVVRRALSVVLVGVAVALVVGA